VSIDGVDGTSTCEPYENQPDVTIAARTITQVFARCSLQ
jgi:hypothetical protein